MEPSFLNNLSDEQLVACLRETGENQFFDELAGRHMKGVRAMIFPMVLNDADADDLTQDTMLKVIGNLPKFRGEAKFGSWLRRVAANTALTFLKRRGRSPLETLASIPDELHPTTSGQCPSCHISRSETDNAINAAIAELSPSLRLAITMVSINGLSPGEAAKAAGCLESTLYRRLHEGRRQLKLKLKEYLP